MLDWLPTSERAVAAVSGPLVVLGYLVGSIPFGYLQSRVRLRRQLRGLDRGATPGPAAGPGRELPGAALSAVLAATAALAVTALAREVAREATPGGPQFSGVGIFSNQAIAAWTSVSLWAGAAAVVGHIAPVWLRFRGGTGVPPAAALALVHVPLVFVTASFAFLGARLLTGRTAASLLAALPVVVAAEYGAWLWDVQAAWGVTNGPEVALWTTVVAAALFARNLRDARGTPERAGQPPSQ